METQDSRGPGDEALGGVTWSPAWSTAAPPVATNLI